ncbi:MAG: nuclear transport factor 2 family protein [Sporocytophaga sp.]|uniref:nuclear transport factor 2 family protein n=1 Tax=Sporocytophaga sp. TaxID=2231183 RepID=UPI001AFE1B64|nr:nuclear transport factor 2 family protein [Sporocytophaga sp.]MBO9703353.1 nuclear transport factor 2 family protein [Sporocytophaga sp.]
MNLPNLITAFVKAQNAGESAAYVACFTPDAVVFDEGKNHRGRDEIKAWKEETNEKYNTVMEPVEYSTTDDTGKLSAKISGTFEGSPILLNFHFAFADGLIRSLKITN